MRTVVDEFERQAAETPAHLALSDGARRLTYRELDLASNRVAHAILESEAAATGPQPVGVLLPQSADAVMSLLAVSKAGHIRLPLDPETPPARLREIVAHAGARIVVTDTLHRSLVEELGGITAVELDRFPADLPDSPPHVELGPDSLFGLVYTSGSTGRPKAVASSHRATLELVLSLREFVPLGPDDRTAVVSGLGFAASRTVERALIHGASVHPFDLGTLGPARFARWVAEERITYFLAMTSVLRALLDELPDGESLPELRRILIVGEPLYRHDVERALARINPRLVLLYGYGATEMGGMSTVMSIDAGTELPEHVLCAGPALPGVDVLLDDASEDGVGEIVVRSPFVADGYWNDPELTATAFERDPRDSALRSFRTGDLGRLRPDGALEVLGRTDARVKIRGYSVDPTEVERALVALPDVAAAAVTRLERAGAGERLAAYFVPAGDRLPTTSVLRRSLLELLPLYMVPAVFVPVDALPLTQSGKVNRRALPPVPTSRPELDEAFVPPRDDLERTIAGVWEEILEVAPVGVEDDFYALGGDSLAAAQAKLGLEQALGTEVPLLLFAEATASIGQIAAALRTRDTLDPLVALQPAGSAPPFFCVSGVGGELLELSALAPYLAPDHPFYGLQLVGKEGDRAVRSVQALAGHYIEVIRRFRPAGPIVLGGYSGGGAVAFEMARLLDREGSPPAAVVLLDTPSPQIMADSRFTDRLAPVELRWKKRLLRVLLDLTVLARREIPARWREVYRTNRGIRALRSYHAEPWDGRLVLLQTGGAGPRSTAGWDELARGGVQRLPVPGGHHSMLMSPYVSGVAAALRSVLPDAPAVVEPSRDELATVHVA